MKCLDSCSAFLVSAVVLVFGVFPVGALAAGEGEDSDKEVVEKWMKEAEEKQKEENRKGEKREESDECIDCYVPLVAGRMPMNSVLASSRLGMDFGWQMAGSLGAGLHRVELGLEGEYAIMPRVLSLGIRGSVDFNILSFGGSTTHEAALRSFELGAKGTLYDNKKGTALAVAGKFGIGNAEVSGANADYAAFVGAAMGSLAWEALRLVCAVGGGYQAPIDDRLKGVGMIQWIVQPSAAVSGPHNFAFGIGGTLAFGENGEGDSDYVHMVDLMLGYVKGGEDVHVSAMVAFPLNHTSRADVGFFVTFGSGF